MSGSPTDDLVEVRLLQLPLVLRERSLQQGADLLREMALVRVGKGPGSTPDRLVELAAELDAVYRPYAAAEHQEMDAALDRGEEVFAEVRYRLPAAATALLRQVQQVLAEVEGYCRADGYLLTLAPPSDIAAYRDWSIGEVLRQYAGSEAVSWPVYAAGRGLDARGREAG